MYTLIALIILLLILFAFGAVYSAFKTQIVFFVTGLDAGFSLSDLVLLWSTAQICNLDEPKSLFFSMQALTRCMTEISNHTASEDNEKYQILLSKLFKYRTKIQNESDDKKGLSDTSTLEKGQTLRIIFPGKGVFVSKLLNNDKNLTIEIPKQKEKIIYSADEWVGKTISVFLWRKSDARYVFDTTVLGNGIFLGKSVLFLKHSANLVRTQKRKAVRVTCNIYGMLYIIKKNDENLNAIETQNGFRCLIEDISESGALIRIGGKGVVNAKIKLQFTIRNKLILMSGIIRTVEFNENENQSKLHFECTHIETSMRNEVLKFVYNLLPETEKEVLEALAQTDEDIAEEAKKSEQSDENHIDGEADDTDETQENKTDEMDKTDETETQNSQTVLNAQNINDSTESDSIADFNVDTNADSEENAISDASSSSEATSDKKNTKTGLTFSEEEQINVF
ncbi:flagellar brake protein [Treponema sp. Marseille-Q3903]|uniref:flagellar brake protein n=1 Tax=Treponema sp. Marseille-Q3903 TaxID=2766703 RepID=UPI0016529170|nr:PilZ domain-containing protein [Treponema sp. Marseille-Q3903]MBC6713621.1 PilZ domain-containing protein [Treponema sp. Marseille-Q3903]